MKEDIKFTIDFAKGTLDSHSNVISKDCIIHFKESATKSPDSQGDHMADAFAYARHPHLENRWPNAQGKSYRIDISE